MNWRGQRQGPASARRLPIALGIATVAARFLLLAIVLAVAGVFAPSTWACRYNVRDLGFVDLGEDRYTLYLLVDDAVSHVELGASPT